MDKFDRFMREVQAETALCWKMTPALLTAFGPEEGQCDNDAYEAAFLAAARDVGTRTMLDTWALMLWPTLPARADAASMAELLRTHSDRAWLEPSGALLQAAARYALDPTTTRFGELIEVYPNQLAPACPSHVELWECCWYWALHLYQVTAAAGGFELIAVLTDQHHTWSAGQPDSMLAPALALLVGTLAAGDRDTAKTYLIDIVGRGADLRELASVWLTGLSRLVPRHALDEVIVTEHDGTPVSMGSVDELHDEDLRTLAVLTRDLVSAVQRRDKAAADAAEPRVTALPVETAFHWVWLLAGMVADRIAQINTKRAGAQ